MDNFFDNNRILTSVLKWKGHIIAVVAFATVVSAIISGPLFITPKFKSTAKVYPVNITEASEESESENLLEHINSNDIKFRVIDAFRLNEVYKISREDQLYLTNILATYNENIQCRKTDYESIEISVLDVDPQRAALIADSLIVFLNEMMLNEDRKIHFENAQTAKIALDKKKMELDSILTIINQIRDETGLVDYWVQTSTATGGLMEAVARGGDRKPALDIINQLHQHGGEMRKHQKALEAFETVADTLQRRYDKSMMYASQSKSYTKLVERPFVSDKKAYPIRWLIVMLAVFATTFISIITVSLIDYIRENKGTL